MREAAAACVPILFAMMLFGILAESASANFKPYQPPQITILSPSSSETYNSSSVSLDVSVQLFGGYGWAYDDVTSLNYSLDGQQDVTISFARLRGVLACMETALFLSCLMDFTVLWYMESQSCVAKAYFSMQLFPLQ